MPSRVWSHLCSYASIDSLARVSIIEEIETFYATQLPVMLPTLYVISKWAGHAGESYTLQVRMLLPEESRQAGRSEYFWVGARQDFTIGKNYAYIAKVPHVEEINLALASVFTLTFTTFGDYPVEFLIDGVPVHILPFRVVQWNG